MRSISVASCLTALAAISLASACKSDEARSADQQQPSTTTQSDQSAASPAGVAQHRPALPVPRRMRSSQPEAAAGGDQDGDPGSAAGDREERREEMREGFAEMRKKFDADGDGQLNDQERASMRQESLVNRVKQLDGDGDGKLSREELEGNPSGGRMLRDFDSMDRDRDSYVTPAEIEAARAERRARWNERQRRGDDQAGQPGAPARSPADL